MSGGIELQPGSTSASSVPTINNSGLESGSTTPAAALNKQSVIGDPQTAQTSGIAPLDKAQTGDLLSGTESKAEGGMSATQLLSSGVETVKEAAGTTAQTAADLANSAFEAVMGGSEKK